LVTPHRVACAGVHLLPLIRVPLLVPATAIAVTGRMSVLRTELQCMRSAEHPLHEQPIQARLRDPSLARCQLLIGGHWRGASRGGYFRVRNPATGELLGS